MKFKDLHIFAFWQGLYERLREGDAFGRTHSDLEWNEAYDRGANVADALIALTRVSR